MDYPKHTETKNTKNSTLKIQHVWSNKCASIVRDIKHLKKLTEEKLRDKGQ